MGFRVSMNSFQHSQHDHGREAPAALWPHQDSLPFFSIDTGDNVAGNGGNGFFSGYMIDRAYAAFEPVNTAEADVNATAGAHQTNVASFDQATTQIGGTGGNGGDGNTAIGGSVHGSGSIGSDAIATGGNGAGNGGDGYFSGALVDAPVAIFDPINIAIAGFHGTAEAHQSNVVQFEQGALQLAGIGGTGGSGNAAIGGDTADAAPHAPQHAITGISPAPQQGSIGSGGSAILSGDNHAGNGGDGYFYGSLVHTSVALYDPINIAVAGYGSTSYADQSNNVTFDQSAVQIAGVGGKGGSGNAAIGGDAGGLASILGLIGSDVIATGGNSAGIGGSGHFAGSLVDLNIAIYAPINIAIAGPNSTAEADQTNNVTIDQSAIQVAGVGGEGGHGNVAFGGDVAMHLLSDLHLPGHG
jgi:hypothetical protein